ncbi:PEP-CTERM sorting domain-containing protein [Aestuariispira insulae]|uniref:Putative secreted protein n=1 Tax=Aestuariispira insulae TaxID=1461337 RepID=A0A3D9HS24_9PROT|nr:PEP-CTERM sorting domain-containing protein [Aestuariispira insulae]RED52215.1 putative secreted protein [Aestuariispira insulae]
MFKKLAFAASIMLLSFGTGQAAILDSNVPNSLEVPSENRMSSDQFLLTFDMTIQNYDNDAGSNPHLYLGYSGNFAGSSMVLSYFHITDSEIGHFGFNGESSYAQFDFGSVTNQIAIGIDYATDMIDVFINGVLASSGQSSALSYDPQSSHKVFFDMSARAFGSDEIIVDISNETFVSGTNRPGTGTDVPEPAMAGLIGLSLIGMGAVRRRRRHQAN